ncbi:aquaporin [Candidatus Saccharibacteria bacterium]|nr:aquaporin [Candidatus Saccharibacteria bacterium]
MAKSKKTNKKGKSNKPVVKEEKPIEKEKKKVEKEEIEETEAVVEEEIEEEVESEEVEEDVEEAEEVKETKKKEDKKSAEKKLESKKEKTSDKKFFKSLFAKKYKEEESILTIFKDNKIYGSLLGEVFGTMFIAIVIFTLGMTQPLYMFFILFAIVIAVYKLSGAQLNPINTFGMMLSRRMSAIRGVLYLLSQVVGAWLGYVIVKAFIGAGVGITGNEAEFPAMAAIGEGTYWAVTFLEFLGATVVGYFYARAQEYKKNVLAFSAVVAGGMTVAIVAVYLLSYAYFGLSGNFMMNPAISLMYGILPQSADGLLPLLGGIAQALFTYVLFPMIGGVVGFYLSDVAKILSEE